MFYPFRRQVHGTAAIRLELLRSFFPRHELAQEVAVGTGVLLYFSALHLSLQLISKHVPSYRDFRSQVKLFISEHVDQAALKVIFCRRSCEKLCYALIQISETRRV